MQGFSAQIDIKKNNKLENQFMRKEKTTNKQKRPVNRKY